MKKGTIIALLLTAVMAAMTSCGTSTQVKEVWRDPDFHGKFRRIYVIGIAKNFKLRERFEQECKTQFRAAGIDAVASIDSYDELKNLTKEVIKSEVAAQDCDGVLIAHVIDYKKERERGRAADLWRPPRHGLCQLLLHRVLYPA